MISALILSLMDSSSTQEIIVFKETRSLSRAFYNHQKAFLGGIHTWFFNVFPHILQELRKNSPDMEPGIEGNELAPTSLVSRAW